MINNFLREYEALVLEKSDIERRIATLEEELEEYKRGKRAQDKVSGGAGGAQRFTVRGFPCPEYERKKTLLMARKLKMESMQKKIESMIGEVEDYINKVESSDMRMILRLRFLDQKSWEEVARALGPGRSKDAVRKKCERFMLEKLED